MKNLLNVIFAAACYFCAAWASAESSIPALSFDQVKAKILGQTVQVFDGGNYSRGTRNVLTSMGRWMIVNQTPQGDYKLSYPDSSRNAFQIVGKTAVVVSVERSTDGSSRPANKIDIFGKAVSPPRELDPDVTIVVRLTDSENLVGVSGKFSLIYFRSLMTPEDASQLKKDVQNFLAKKIGSTIYNVRYTDLLPPDLGIDEIVSDDVRRGKRDTEISNLTPLKIVDVVYVDRDNAVVLKVEMPSREVRLIFGTLASYYQSIKDTKFDRMGISVLENPSRKFSPKEISSIKKSEIFRGMSRDALWASWGFEGKSNDWGSGGEQKIFHETTFVYLKNNFVRDWQMLQ